MLRSHQSLRRALTFQHGVRPKPVHIQKIFRQFHTTRPLLSQDDLYAILGVPRNATPEMIKSTYYQHAKKLHPDLPQNRGNEASKKHFASISAAYDVLGDEQKRAKYDKYGHQAANIDEEELMGQINNMFGGEEEELKDLRQGENIEYPLTLKFEEAALGTTKDIEYKVKVTCTDCNGSGGAPGSKIQTCSLCMGIGYTSSGSGLFHVKKACSQCQGYGTLIDKQCKCCAGSGTVTKKKKLLVKIPPGVDSDHQVTIKGKGNTGPRQSGKHGTLFLAITVAPHARFTREKNDVHITVPITVSQAILGDTIKIPSLLGAVELKVPPGVQPGEKRVLTGRGINSNGNQYVHFQVVIPKNLPKDRVDLIRQFGKGEVLHEPSEHTSQLAQTWSTIKRFFGRE